MKSHPQIHATAQAIRQPLARRSALVTAAAVVVFCTLFAGNLLADCGVAVAGRSGMVRQEVPAPMQLGQERVQSPQERDAGNPNANVTIVGLWKVNFVTDGQIVDQGFDLWHADGTEVLNDTPPPATGNICFGVWTQTGKLVYKLHHVSWNFDPAGNLIGTSDIREQVTLDKSGNSYTGSFTLDSFDLTGNPVFHLAGQLNATRITAD